MEKRILEVMMGSSPDEVWRQLLDYSWELFSNQINPEEAEIQIAERDRKIGEMDTFLAGSAWDLWDDARNSQFKTADFLKNFWEKEKNGKAVLILDALSLREAYWILEQAHEHGFVINRSCATLAEIPGDTSSFARALGYGQRSLLTDNGGRSNKFPDAYTESTEMPFYDSEKLIKPERNIFFWHHWPDTLIHEFADDGNGGQKIIKGAMEVLRSDAFWRLIERLSAGRKVVITGDHGYANSGLFRDITDKEQSDYMKTYLKSGRFSTSDISNQHRWVPPLTLQINNAEIAIGRRKWKSQGGYPTLTHGGLSILEIAVPFIEIEKRG